ncbi:MAG: hypothetical protein ABSA06_14145 [Geobacteraceae bacterium]|jgi:hypothetical protein
MSYRNSIPFNMNIKPDPTEYVGLIDYLRERLSSHRSIKSWRSIRERHLLLILQNLHIAYQMAPDTYVAYSRNKNDYSTEESRKAPFKVSYGATIRIVDALSDMHLIEGVKGIFYDDKNDPDNPLLAFVARMRATQQLYDMFPGGDVGSLRLVSKESELIVLHDADGKVIPFIDDEETQRMRENIRLINSVNRQHFIALCVLDVEFQNLFRRMNSERYAGQSSLGMYFCHTGVRRIFCNSTFEEGGRYYGGWWENLKWEYRKFIRIDNRMVVELDYSCLHPTLIYLEDKLPVPEGDMYEVPGFPPEARDFLKKSMNIILNAKNETSAMRAIRSEQRKDPDYPALPEGFTLRQVLDGFKKKHSGIERHFFSIIGRRLQRVDSDIAEGVMLRLVAGNIPVLPLHDSFLVSRLHKDALLRAMNEIVSERYGEDIKVKPDETAWNFIYDIGLEDEYDHDIERNEREAINNPSFTTYNQQIQLHNTAATIDNPPPPSPDTADSYIHD